MHLPTTTILKAFFFTALAAPAISKPAICEFITLKSGETQNIWRDVYYAIVGKPVEATVTEACIRNFSQ
jgi:hypothetical protein